MSAGEPVEGDRPKGEGMVAAVIVSVVMMGTGLLIMLTPAENLLTWERGSGYWVYRRELRASGDEKRAVAKAAFFYKMFGGCFVVVGGAVFVGALISIFSGGIP